MSATLEERGQVWVTKTTCQDCGAEIVLKSEHKPTPLALKIAGLGFRTCDSCGAKREAAEKAVERQRVFDGRVHGSLLPRELRELRFEDMDRAGRRSRAIDAAEQWAAEGDGGLYLCGPKGVGKTRLAATAMWARLEHGPMRWVSVAQLVANLDRAWGDAERREALRVLTGTDPIVLDDFDKVVPSERGRNHLFTAIDQRAQAGVPMIVTANVRIGELGSKFGDPIMSRLAGHCAAFELTGPDRRLQMDMED